MSSFFQQTLANHFKALDSAYPFYATRKQAWEDFRVKGLPTSKDEAYKYTPMDKLLAANFDVNQPVNLVQTPSEELTAVRYHDIDAYHIVLCNGQLSSAHTQLEGCERFMQVLTFQDAYQQQHRTFLGHFAQHAQSKEDAFTALNTALFEEGLFIHIADHAIVDKPLLIYHYDTAWSTYQPMIYPRLLVVAGRYSQASVITSWQTMGFTNATAEVVLQDNAQLDYYTLQIQMGKQHHQVNTMQFEQAQRSRLNTYTLTWSGALVRNNLNIIIDAPHSETNMYGLYCLRGQQHIDNCTIVDHRQPHTHSNELYKGIMMGEATGVFNGRIYVRPEAQETNALQTNNNLMLSSGATLHTKPQLEIWADDVKCSHGATTGQIDEAQIFYLRTRGLSEDIARYLLQQAFADEVINKIPLATLRTQLHNSLSFQDTQGMIW